MKTKILSIAFVALVNFTFAGVEFVVLFQVTLADK